MNLIAGLGNPDKIYKYNRHNVGFMALDLLASEYKESFTYNKKFNADICEIAMNDKKAILIKPMTYMNLSGEAVRAVKNFYKINTNNIIVIYDDIDLRFAQVKKSFNVSSGGHNGIKSIDSCLGSREYSRIRIGIGRPENLNIDIADFVLSDFSREEYGKIVDVITNNIIKDLTL